MHVAGVSIFAGEPPTYEELLEHVEGRLSLVPRFRQKLRFVPFGQGRPVWVDDPHFNLEYHVRSTALPPPGSEEQLKNLASRVFAQQLDRTKPLWEIWLVEGLGPADVDRRRLRGSRSPTAAVRAPFQDAPRARRRRRRRRHHRGAVRHGCRPRDAARPGHALAAAARADLDAAARRRADRARDPAGRGRALGAGGIPRAAPDRRPRHSRALAADGSAGARPAWAPRPRSLNVDIGPHRRFDWVRTDLERHQGDQEQARRHRQRRRAGGRHRGAARLPAAARRAGGRRHAEGDGAGQRAARERVRHDRQPRRGDDGAAARSTRWTRSSACGS